MVALVCADELVDNAALVVSETVTNAVVHACSAPRLRVSVVDDRLRVEVHDTSRALPVLCAPSAAAGGQGLRIVTAVAHDCGWSATSTGKVVWTELRPVARPLQHSECPIMPPRPSN
jgi:anti-sigma regulatory factor (Ser/Thr protein kinase)